MANRYFLPIYPAFWFLASRPLPRLVPLGVAVLASVFLWPLWSAPRSFPLTEERGYRWVSSTAHRMLPYETTQSHLKPGGRDDVTFNGLWIKFLDSGARPTQGEQLLLVDAAGARLLVGSAAPIEKLEARFSEGSESDFTLGGGVAGPVRVDGDSPVLSLEPPALKAKHPMWWQWEPYYLYEVKVGTAADRPIRFELRNVGPSE